jgi:hypothetical protein
VSKEVYDPVAQEMKFFQQAVCDAVRKRIAKR